MRRMLIPGLTILLLVAALLSLLAGTFWLSPAEALESFTGGRESLSALIIGDIRLPRTLLAVMIGAILGLNGAALQGLLRNPLAEPGVLGVSAWAALFATVTLFFGLAGWSALALPIASMLGAMAATAVIAVSIPISR